MLSRCIDSHLQSIRIMSEFFYFKEHPIMYPACHLILASILNNWPGILTAAVSMMSHSVRGDVEQDCLGEDTGTDIQTGWYLTTGTWGRSISVCVKVGILDSHLFTVSFGDRFTFLD